MQILIILLGVVVFAIGIFKQLTKFAIGYQLINIPGYVTAILGFFIVVLGILLP